VYDAKNYTILNTRFTGHDSKATYLADDFALVFDRVLNDTAVTVPFNTTPITPDDTASVSALNFQLGWALRLYRDVYPSDTKTTLTLLQNMLLIPIQFSIAAWQYANATTFRNFTASGLPPPSIFALPDELDGKVVVGAKSIPRVAAVPWSVYTFIGGGSALLLYVAAILWWILIQKELIPNGSGFAELMFASKAQAPERWEGRVAAIKYLWDNGMSNAGSAEAVKRVKDVDIVVGVVGTRIVMVVVAKGTGRPKGLHKVEEGHLYL
jgi:hypothetical protein